MSLDRLFDEVEGLREKANWQAVFGEPRQVGEQTIIPVAQVTYGFGLGFGRGMPKEPKEGEEAATESPGEGGGGGAGGGAKPLGVIVVTPDRVRFESTGNPASVALAGIAMVAWTVWQINKTVRVFARQRKPKKEASC